MKYAKRLILLSTLTPMLFGMTGCANNQLASVNHEKISTKDLFAEMKNSKEVKTQLSSMVVTKALNNEFGNDDTNKKVDKEFSKYNKKYGKKLDDKLALSGMNQESLKDGLLFNELLKKAVVDIKPITDKEMKTAVNNYPEKRLTQHILVKDKKTADLIINKLNNGEKFDKLVDKFSIDEGTKFNHGKIYAFDKNNSKLAKEYVDATFKLGKINAISALPVKSSYGYHVIKLNKIITKKNVDDKTIKDELIDKRLDDKKVVKKAIKKALNKSNVKIEDGLYSGILDGYK